jgi:hypothetical protein
VWHVEALTANGYEELKLDQTYRVATNAFTADGGDGYTMFKKAKDEGRIAELYIVDFEVFTSYLEKNNPVSPVVEGRIVQEVSDTVAPDAPVVNEVTDQSTEVTGTTEAGAKVEVSVGDTVIGTGTALENGSFSVGISKLTAGTKLSVTATDEAGNVSDSTAVTVLDVTAPGVPKVNPVIHNDTVVSGKAEAGATIMVKTGGKNLGKAVADEAGSFMVTVSKLKKGTEIEVTAVDKAGNVSETAKVTVLAKKQKGWVKEDSKWYYYDNDGEKVTGWMTLKKETYYLDPAADGERVTGWNKIDGKWYYFNGDGELVYSGESKVGSLAQLLISLIKGWIFNI